eukprot:TRINITY_DN22926_c0_g1_i1.p1 TRINITY_DN22926_c0_g1~~TRINITY_DN22926_c0_g1_i1.p1  ORF type:complete len:153 (-),score=33.13 TRINITY_DN22926_c0_g1_i1:35-493(-)
MRSSKQRTVQPLLLNEFLDSQPYTGDISLNQNFVDIGKDVQAILKTRRGKQLAQKIGVCVTNMIKNTGQLKAAIGYCFNYAKKVCQDNLFIAGLLFLLLLSVTIDFVFNRGTFTKMTIKEMIMPIINQIKELGIPGIMAMHTMYMQPSKQIK